jgi:hypothetical protein
VLPSFRRFSITGRLTLLFSGATLAILLIISLLLHWRLGSTLEAEDETILRENMDALLIASQQSDGLAPAIIQQVALEAEVSRQEPYYVRSFVGDSIVYECYKRDVPIFCPAFSDCSAGFGLVAHLVTRGDEFDGLEGFVLHGVVGREEPLRAVAAVEGPGPWHRPLRPGCLDLHVVVEEFEEPRGVSLLEPLEPLLHELHVVLFLRHVYRSVVFLPGCGLLERGKARLEAGLGDAERDAQGKFDHGLLRVPGLAQCAHVVACDALRARKLRHVGPGWPREVP